MRIVQLLLAIGYPVLIFFALSWFEPREVAVVVLGLAALRLVAARSSVALALAREIWMPAAAVAIVATGTAIWNDPMGLLVAPVLINLALLATFGSSLFSGRPMVERFARLHVGTLSDPEVRYCRTVTRIWCGFFVANGAIALYLALAGSLEAWALYTGLISYILIGTLLGTEYIYRHWRFRRFTGGFADPVLKRFFPPPSEAVAESGAGSKDTMDEATRS
jgi:uncharacterized membrane protein